MDDVYGLEGGVGFYDVLPGATAVAKRAAVGRNRLALSFPDLKNGFMNEITLKKVANKTPKCYNDRAAVQATSFY